MPHPLHPAVVHFPLVLAVLFPFVAVVALYASRRPAARRAAWLGLVVMALLLVGSAWLSIETGQRQEDVVERVVSEQFIHGHEEAAEGLLIGAVVVLGIVLAGLLPGKTGKVARWASIAGGVAVLLLAFRVGASGGALVYEHGAASAYVNTAPGVGGVAPGDEARRSEEDRRGGDDDHR